MIRKLIKQWLSRGRVSTEGGVRAATAAPSQFKLSDNYNFSQEFVARGIINGVAVPFFCTPEFRAEVQEKFKLRPSSDIFIVTYPKSGTTWTQKIVRELLFNDDPKHYADMTLSNRIPMVDAPHEMQLDVVEDMPSPRVFKVHNNTLEEMDNLMLKGDRNSKFIYVHRDPRDVAVSLFCHLRGVGISEYMNDVSFDDYHKNYMRNKDEVFYGLWETHLQNWLSKRDELNMLVLNYATMKDNPRSEIKRIAGFLDLDATEEQIENVAEKTTIAYMKKETNVIADESGLTSSVLRKGTVGDWENFFVDKNEAEKMVKIREEIYDKYKL